MPAHDSDQPSSSARDQAAAWFVRQENHPLTGQEKALFEQWLNSDPLHREEFQAIQRMWRELDGLQGLATHNKKATKRRWPHALAASLLIGVCTGLFVFLYDPNSYQTDKGEQLRLRLADHSLVHLNSDTSLQVKLTDEERILTLHKGEAYFEVSHDPDRPFIVITAGGRARALGTRFNVDNQASRVQVTVVEGRVKVATENGDSRLVKAEEMVAYPVDGQALSSIAHPDKHALAWLEGQLYFEATPLSEVVTQLNRYVDTPLRIADPELNTLKLSGSFRISHLEALPKLLPRLLPVSLTRHNGYLEIRRQ